MPQWDYLVLEASQLEGPWVTSGNGKQTELGAALARASEDRWELVTSPVTLIPYSGGASFSSTETKHLLYFKRPEPPTIPESPTAP